MRQGKTRKAGQKRKRLRNIAKKGRKNESGNEISRSGIVKARNEDCVCRKYTPCFLKNVKRGKTMDEKTLEVCECEHTHESVVEEARRKMPSEEVVYDVAELFKVFGDSTRTNILMALFESEMCVCDIGELLKMTKSAISHQLRILRQSKLVKSRKVGKEVFYSLADDHVVKIFEMAIEHVNE